jgi:predicted kinase
MLVAVGGLSGSGKSTVALGLAPLVGAVAGAVVLRSDETRKRLCGVALLADHREELTRGEENPPRDRSMPRAARRITGRDRGCRDSLQPTINRHR